jgi:hypothetical protein
MVFKPVSDALGMLFPMLGGGKVLRGSLFQDY